MAHRGDSDDYETDDTYTDHPPPPALPPADWSSAASSDGDDSDDPPPPPPPPGAGGQSLEDQLKQGAARMRTSSKKSTAVDRDGRLPLPDLLGPPLDNRAEPRELGSRDESASDEVQALERALEASERALEASERDNAHLLAEAARLEAALRVSRQETADARAEAEDARLAAAASAQLDESLSRAHSEEDAVHTAVLAALQHQLAVTTRTQQQLATRCGQLAQEAAARGGGAG